MIIIIGLPLFAKRLAEDLQSLDPSVRYVALNTYESRADRLKFMLLLPFASTVISMNGVSVRSGSLDWVLRFRKRLILQWMGTDILKARSKAEDGSIDRRYIDYAENYVDSTWMQDELKIAGVATEILYFKYAKNIGNEPRPYAEVKVLTYVAQIRQKFYGLDEIANLARMYPQIKFEVAGTEFSDFELPGNVICLGWISEDLMQQKMQEASIFLRLTDHDGFSSSVIEALSFGCEVLWTFPFDNVIFVSDKKQLAAPFNSAMQALEKRGNLPNEKNIRFISEAFSKENVLRKYISQIHSK